VELTRVEVRDVTVRGRVDQSAEIGISLDECEREVERLSSLFVEVKFFGIHLVDFNPGIGCRRWRMRYLTAGFDNLEHFFVCRFESWED